MQITIQLISDNINHVDITWSSSAQYHHIAYIYSFITLHQTSKLKSANVIITIRNGWTDGHSYHL